MSEPVDLDAVLEEIRIAAETARADGVYPDGLEEQIRSDFVRQLERPDHGGEREVRFNTLRHLAAEVDAARNFGPELVSRDSNLPGGSYLHEFASRAFAREINGVYGQVRNFADSVVPLVDQMVMALEDPTAHVHDDLVHEIDIIRDRLGELQRAFDLIGASSREVSVVMARMLEHLNTFDGLDARLERIEAVERSLSVDVPIDYGAFEDMARGDSADIESEYLHLATELVNVPGPVLDIGAGRGEFLGLLKELDKESWGVDLDRDLVTAGQSLGLDIRHEDGLDALRRESFGSLGAIVMVHVVEHLQPPVQAEMVKLGAERLAPGGLFIIETPNPQSLYIYARAFWLDPTHLRPVRPRFLQFLGEQSGLELARIDWTAHPADEEKLLVPTDDSELGVVVAENAQRANDLLFGPQNYRIILRRP